MEKKMVTKSELIPAGRLTRKVGTTEDFKGDKRWKVSPTQVKAWGECPRKWGFRYLDGIKTPQGAAAALGTEVHGILEDYLTNGKAPDVGTKAGKIAAAGLEHLPGPGECEFVETQLLFDWEGILFRGFVDVVWTGADGVPVVSDHKTSSDPKKWGLSEAALPFDVQSLIYATWLLDLVDAPMVDLRWTYFRTRGKAIAFPVDARITREDARQNFKERVEPNAREIIAAVETHQETGALAGTLPANPSACGNYGGCDFAVYCVRTQEEVISSIFGKSEKGKKKEMGLKELLAKKNGRKLPPPRASEIAKGVNSPEAPASNEVAREISKVVGTITGNPQQRKAQAREAAAAAAGETNPSQAAQKAEAAVAAAVASTPPKVSKAQAAVLELLAEQNPRSFSKTRPGQKGHPFVHGRTLNAMVREGLITVEETGDLRAVRLVDAGTFSAVNETEPTVGQGPLHPTAMEMLKAKVVAPTSAVTALTPTPVAKAVVAEDRLTEIGEALADAFLDALIRRLSK
jgi:hypothetical protein